MQEQISEIIYYAKGALRYKWHGIVVAWMVCLIGWLFVLAMPNKYTSEAKVHVETRTMLQPLLQGMTIQSDVRGLLRVMQLLMFTQSNLEEIIKLSDLGKTVQTEAERQGLIARLKKDIQINGGGDDIFSIKYEALDPDMAKNVVQAVLTVFSEQTHKSTISGADVAKKFIDEQIRDYETRLRNAEKARENFKRANYGLLPGEGGDQIAQVQSTASLLADAKMKLNETLSRRDVLLAQMNEIKESDADWSVTDLQQDQHLSEEDTTIDVLTTRKKELLVRYTEKHPEIVSINKTIALMKSRKLHAERVEPEANPLIKPSVMANPYIQTIKVALNESEAEVASSQSRVKELQQRVDKIGTELNSRLTVETELKNLNRDYDAIKSNYEKLLESREQAKMSEKVDNQAEALKFKIADAPNKPLKSSSPNRELLFSAIFLGGGVCGLGLALLLYFIRPTIMSTLQLRQLTGLPVLGSVSLKITGDKVEKYRKDRIRYSFAGVGLVVIYVGFMAIEMLGIKFFSLSKLLQSIT
ncbi:putative Polysaccharide chain length determinant protein [Crenothrix polyspora]|uniref:Putative Polysaccharide chain length determinant protein n=1 Tax=Crenothrix polyspora TaxID=360316 RepID=A0A1R4HGV3_9GAMM|nr:XrtA system polysaccharide chain length determinant [Crenothrix polyspora]SJM95100.1 putative Polysaccharide chain length determinant protein [Crenothrix polyspora]